MAILFLHLLLHPWVSFAGSIPEGRWEEPWGEKTSLRLGQEAEPGQEASPAQKVAEGLFRFFQKYVSPVDGDRCPSFPSCSQYGLEAVRKHGVLTGLMMTFGRLIHESDEIQNAPLVWVHGSYRYFDPVENNDFWWHKK